MSPEVAFAYLAGDLVCQVTVGRARMALLTEVISHRSFWHLRSSSPEVTCFSSAFPRAEVEAWFETHADVLLATLATSELEARCQAAVQALTNARYRAAARVEQSDAIFAAALAPLEGTLLA